MRFWKVLIGVVIVLWGALTLYLPLSSPQGIFNTPDENANYFFATHFSFYDGLQVFESLSQEVDNALHPRGVNVINSFLVPESFLGLPFLYGTLFAVHAEDLAIFVFAGVLALLGLYALYNLFLHFFERSLARLALLLVLFTPVFLYWSGRPFMHTILFFDLLVLGWWLLLRGQIKWHIVSGILLGFALAVRTSEVVWIAFATLLIFYQRPQKESRLDWIAALLKLAFGTALVIVPLLFVNQDLYGNFFGTGYSVTETNLVLEEGAVPQLSQSSLLKNIFLPFGFHPIEAFSRFIKYAFGGMWWYVAPMVLGAVVGIMNHESRTMIRRGYLVVWGLLSMYLILIYGSFRAEVFADPAHPLDSTIGAPYLRYWLPIFVFGAPLVAEFLMFIRNRIMNNESGIKNTLGYVLRSTFYVPVVMVLFLTLRSVVWHGPESWFGVQDNLWQFAEFRERVVRATSENAIFLVPRWADRIYFSARGVIVDVEGKDVVGIIKTLHTENISVFWHRGRGEIKLEPELSAAGLKLERRFDLDPKGKLYEIRN